METAFDTEQALENLNSEDLINIENYIEESRDLLAGTIYENKTPFRFFPGHRALLLNIPKKIAEKKLEKKEKKSKSDGLNNTLDIGLIDDEQKQKYKTELIAKLTNYCTKIGLYLNLETKDISNFVSHKDRIKCFVQCPHCTVKKTFTCFKEKYWAYSTFSSHLKKHKQKIVENSENTPHNNVTPSIRKELNEVLNN